MAWILAMCLALQTGHVRGNTYRLDPMYEDEPSSSGAYHDLDTAVRAGLLRYPTYDDGNGYGYRPKSPHYHIQRFIFAWYLFRAIDKLPQKVRAAVYRRGAPGPRSIDRTSILTSCIVFCGCHRGMKYL